MKWFLFILITFSILPICFGYREALTSTFFDRYGAERSLLGFLSGDNYWTGYNTFLNVTYNNINKTNASEWCLNDVCIDSWADVNFTYSEGFGIDILGDVISVNTSEIQDRVEGSCPVGSSIRVINEDGTVSCQSSTGGNDTERVDGLIDWKENVTSSNCSDGYVAYGIYENGTMKCKESQGGSTVTYNESGTITVSSGFGSGQSTSFYADVTQVLVEGNGKFSVNITSTIGQKFIKRSRREDTWQLLYPDFTVGNGANNASLQIDLFDAADGEYNYTFWYREN